MGTMQPHDMRSPADSLSAQPRVTGFTLLELLVAVGIVSILAALAAPSFKTMIASQRTRASATDLYLSLTKARSEAIKRNANVTLSPKGGNWHGGWEIFSPVDPASKLDDHNPINGAVISGPASVVYQATGRVRGGTRPTFNFSFPGTDAVACVTVDLSGLPTQKSSSC